MKFLKKVLVFKKTIMLLLFFVLTGIVLYHNDSFYIGFRDKVNTRLTRYTNINILSTVNKIAHATDFLGKIKAINHPLRKTDIIEIKIETKERKKLKKYLKQTQKKMGKNKSES